MQFKIKRFGKEIALISPDMIHKTVKFWRYGSLLHKYLPYRDPIFRDRFLSAVVSMFGTNFVIDWLEKKKKKKKRKEKKAYSYDFYYINWSASQGFPPVGKTWSAHVGKKQKKRIIFHVLEIANYLLARHTVYIALWMNADAFSFWNVNKVVFFSIAAFAHDISSRTLKEKFHISAHPSIILYSFLHFLISTFLPVQ